MRPLAASAASTQQLVRMRREVFSAREAVRVAEANRRAAVARVVDRHGRRLCARGAAVFFCAARVAFGGRVRRRGAASLGLAPVEAVERWAPGTEAASRNAHGTPLRPLRARAKGQGDTPGPGPPVTLGVSTST